LILQMYNSVCVVGSRIYQVTGDLFYGPVLSPYSYLSQR
jgi:hypothetical protein